MNLENYHRKSPFLVPENYFSELEGRILSEVKLSKLKNLPVIEGYFERLEDEILTKVKIEQLNNVSELPVPTDYFKDLENNIIVQVKLEGLNQPSVNEEYFEELELSVLSTIKLESLKQLESPVPVGYFENLERDLLSKTVERKSRFTLFRNVKILRGAAAVALFGLIGYGISYTETQSKPANDKLADISTEAMVAYLGDQQLMEEDLSLVLNNDNNEFILTDFSDKEISAYLSENGI